MGQTVLPVDPNPISKHRDHSEMPVCTNPLLWERYWEWAIDTFKWLPTSLQCITALNMSMTHYQYLFLNSMNSGIVNTEFQNCLYTFLWEFVNGLTHKLGFGEKDVNNKVIPLFSVNHFFTFRAFHWTRIYHCVKHLGLHGGHIQHRHYSSEGEHKRIYIFCTIHDMADILKFLNFKFIWISFYM